MAFEIKYEDYKIQAFRLSDFVRRIFLNRCSMNFILKSICQSGADPIHIVTRDFLPRHFVIRKRQFAR